MVVAMVAAGVAAALDGAGLTERLELPVRDGLLRRLPGRPVTAVALVAIDDQALAAHGAWPWGRARLGALVEAVAASRARGVVVDLLLIESRDDDRILAGALSKLPGVLAVAPGIEGWLLPARELRGAASLGHAAFDPDHDGVVRRMAATKQAAGVSYPALAAAAVRIREPGWAVPAGGELRPDFRLDWGTMPVVGAARLLHDGGHPALAGRVVFIGAVAPGLGDRSPLATGPSGGTLPGVTIHAAAAECLAAGAMLRSRSPFATGVATGGPAALAWLLAGWWPWRRRLAAILLLLVLPWLVGWAALALAGVEVAVVAPVVAVGCLALAGEIRAARRSAIAQARAAAALGAATGATAGGEAGAPEHLEALASAIAERRRAEREARRVMAHELKTPLTSVRGLTQVLAELEVTEEERRRVAGLAAREAERLQRMIEGLLELERLALREFPSQAEVMDVAALAADRAAVLGGGAGGRVVTIAAGPAPVLGDRGLLERVVDNVVGNALAYSPPGTPVTVRVAATGQEAVVEVVDHGPGIPEGERGTVFSRFARGTASAGTQGLGLGLALVAEAVAWHGGTVRVRETPGGGATLEVRLPRAEKGEEQNGARPGG